MSLRNPEKIFHATVGHNNPQSNLGVDLPGQAWQKGSLGDKIKMGANLLGQLPGALVRNFTGRDNFTKGKGITK